MDFQLDFEQRSIQEATQKMVVRDIQPILDAHDADQPLPKQAMQRIFEKCAQIGLTGARIPESAGGSEMSALTMGLMYEQLPPAIGLAVIAHEGTGARLYTATTEEQRERILPGIIDGTTIACTGVSEPGVGSDPRSVRTRATDAGDHWSVDGRKTWITNASVCDVMNVTCSVGKDDKGLASMMRVFVERKDSPFTATEIPMLGLRQGHNCEVLFENCRVPKANALGEAGDAAKVLTLTWLANRPIFGLFAVHLAQKALDAATTYAQDRSQFGRTIAGFQLVQELLADIAGAVTTSRLLCYYALNCIDNGERANQVSAMAKRHAVAACQRAVSLAMEVHGAMGLTREMKIEQLYRDVRMLTVPDGTRQILTLIEGRELTGIAAYRS
jgi:alkylation response protein AidB-like acyl-CoA dehydrogenase